MAASPLRGGSGSPGVVPPRVRRRRYSCSPSWLFLAAAAAVAAAVGWVLLLRRKSEPSLECGSNTNTAPLPEIYFQAPQAGGGGGDGGGGGGRRQVFSFDAPDGPSAPGVGHGHDHQQEQQVRQRERRPPCAPSDDPEYSCLVPRPPGSFKDEIRVYFSLLAGREAGEAVRAAAGDEQQRQQQQEEKKIKKEEDEEQEEKGELLLSVKIVVPPGNSGGGRGWASLGLSPNGKMAGPSEAVVGFVRAAADGEASEGAWALVLTVCTGGWHTGIVGLNVGLFTPKAGWV